MGNVGATYQSIGSILKKKRNSKDRREGSEKREKAKVCDELRPP